MPRETESERVDREGRALLLSDPAAVLHGLLCRRCRLRNQTHLALALVGWEPLDYVSELYPIEGRHADGS